MRLNLRRARESQDLKLNDVSKECHISVDRLRAIEHYQVIPEFYEVIRLLKFYKYYFDEICFIIWQDIDDHYSNRNYSENITIKNYLRLDGISIETIEAILRNNTTGGKRDEK